jgi:hypothetical protein
MSRPVGPQKSIVIAMEEGKQVASFKLHGSAVEAQGRYRPLLAVSASK